MKYFRLLMILGGFLALWLFFFWITAPSGTVLDGRWVGELNGDPYTATFLLHLEQPGIIDLKLSRPLGIPSGETLKIPTLFTNQIRVYLNGSLIGEARSSSYPQPEFFYGGLSFSFESGQLQSTNIMEIELSSQNDLIIFPSPYIEIQWMVRLKEFLFRMFDGYFLFFAIGMNILLAILLFRMGRAINQYENAYFGMGASAIFSSVLIFSHAQGFLSSAYFFEPIYTNAIAGTLASFTLLWGIESYLTKKIYFSKLMAVFTILSLFLIPLIGGGLASIATIVNFALIGTISIINRKNQFFYAVLFLGMALIIDLITQTIRGYVPIYLTSYGTLIVTLTCGLVLVEEYRKVFFNLEATSNQLSASNEELTAINEELEHSYSELDTTIGKFERLVDSTTTLIQASTDSNETFLSQLLERATEIISEADCGSVSLIEGEDWKYIHAVGQDIKKLQEIPLKAEYFEISDTVRKIGLENLQMPEPIKEQFMRVVPSIKETLVVPLRLNQKTLGHMTLDIRSDQDKEFSDDAPRILEALGSLASAFLAFRRLGDMQKRFQEGIILSIIRILEIHDTYTKGHSDHVAEVAAAIAIQLGFSPVEIDQVYWTGMVHDIGKILVPQAILNKPGKLSELEFEVIKYHPVWGFEVLSGSQELNSAAIAVRHHHERFDGNGYPDELTGEEIPLVSRIIAVADTWDAMVRDRSYRRALKYDEAIHELNKHKGTQFDPQVIEAFLRVLDNEDQVKKYKVL